MRLCPVSPQLGVLLRLGLALISSIAIPAPFDTIHARLEPRRDERPEAYDSGSGATLKDWLAAIAARLSAFSNE